jgi:RNA polymerase sigma-70 factor (ECF subfamily)
VKTQAGTDPAPERPDVDWRHVVEQIQAADPAGEETLYKALNAGSRQFLQRRLGTQDVEDRVHDMFLIVKQAIMRGNLREPERLMGFVRTVLYRQVSLGISRAMGERGTTVDLADAPYLASSEPDPEQQVLSHVRVEAVAHELRKLKAKDFDILTRYYLREQRPERIRDELGLSQPQFLLRKSRAKARLAGLLRRKASA